MRRRRRSTLAGQLFALQLAIIAVVLVAVAAVSLAQSAATFERVEGRRVAGLAEQVAGSPLVRASLAETGTRTGLATLAQTLVTQTAVSSVSFAEPDLDVRVSTDPSLEGGRLPIGDPRVAEGASWSGTLELDGRRAPRLAGAGARRVRGCRGRAPRHRDGRRAGAVDVGAAPGHVVLPAHLPGHRARRRPGRLVAALAPDQAADPRHGAARDRRASPSTARRCCAASPRASSPSTRSTGSRWSTRSPASCSTCPSTAIGTSIDDLRIEGRLREVLVGENPSRARRARPRRPRHRRARRGRHPPRPRARHEHDARRERRPRARHGDDDARPHRPGRPRARDRLVPLDRARAARPGPRVRQPAAHDQRAHPDR